ncbi:MAG: hypothetical protein ABIR57_08670 [Aeromicrobium sp.]
MTIWMLARSTGMAALIAFTLSTALGALTASPKSVTSSDQLDRRFLKQMAHRSAAVIGLTLLLAHAILIIVDSFVDVSITGALVPFAAGYRPVALGAGTLSVYAIAAVAVSGALRGRVATSAASARRWRYVHLSAYAGWALAMGHGIFAGTDTGASWATAVYAACGATVLAAVITRLVAERNHRATPLPEARARSFAARSRS